MALAKHFVLAPGVVSRIDVGGMTHGVTLVNRGIASATPQAGPVYEVYVRTDGTDPTIGGDNCLILPAQIGFDFPIAVSDPDIVARPETAANDSIVRLISVGPAAVSIIA